MRISSLIFNEAQNVNQKIINLLNTCPRNPSQIDDNQAIIANRYEPIINRIELKDLKESDPHALKKALRRNHDDLEDAMIDVIGVSPLRDFLESGSTLWYVSDNSLLRPALMEYFYHIDHHHGFSLSAKKFINDFYETDDGFYMTTGVGYDIHDEFFRGIPSSQKINKGVGSGIPTRRFLNYINSDIKDNVEE